MAKVIALNQNPEIAIPTNHHQESIVVGIFVSPKEREILLVKKFNFSMLLLPGGTLVGKIQPENLAEEKAKQLATFVYEKSGFVLKPVKPLFIMARPANAWPIEVFFLEIDTREPQAEWKRNTAFQDVWLSIDKIIDHPQVADAVKKIFRHYLAYEKILELRPKRLQQPVPIIIQD